MRVMVPCSIPIGRDDPTGKYLLLPGKSVVDTSTGRVIYVGQPDTLAEMGVFGFMTGDLVAVGHRIPDVLHALFRPWRSV